MIYNTGWKVSKTIEPPSQEEIFNCPEYFCFSREEVVAHDQCPEFLKKIINQFPWDGRKSVLQIRAQDFRVKVPDALGGSWHTDIMTRLNDGRVRVAKNSHEFHLMVASWGDVCGTDFLKNPMEMRDIFDGVSPEFSPMDLLNTVHRTALDVFTAPQNTIVEYTSADIHRMSPTVKLGMVRLMIVAFDCDSIDGGGLVIPSIEERSRGVGPKFSDYVR